MQHYEYFTLLTVQKLMTPVTMVASYLLKADISSFSHIKVSTEYIWQADICALKFITQQLSSFFLSPNTEGTLFFILCIMGRQRIGILSTVEATGL